MPKRTLLPDPVQIQLANPLPYDLEETRLTEYKNLAPQMAELEGGQGRV